MRLLNIIRQYAKFTHCDTISVHAKHYSKEKSLLLKEVVQQILPNTAAIKSV
jgi:hypothetical protein